MSGHFGDGTVGLGGAMSKSRGAVVPDNADLNAYHQVGIDMPSRVWIEVQQIDGQRFYSSAAELGCGWYATAAHNLGASGTSTIIQVGNGTHPVNDPGATRLVTEQHIYEGFVHSSISGGSYSCDLCVFKSAAPLSEYFAVFPESRPLTGSSTTAGGYGVLAYESTGYVSPQDQTLTGWHADATSAVPFNASNIYYFSLRTTTSTPQGKRGKSSGGNSGCPVLDKDGNLAGLVTGTSGGTSLAGFTVVLDLTHPEAKEFIARYYTPPPAEIICARSGASSLALHWNWTSLGCRVQMNEGLGAC